MKFNLESPDSFAISVNNFPKNILYSKFISMMPAQQHFIGLHIYALFNRKSKQFLCLSESKLKKLTSAERNWGEKTWNAVERVRLAACGWDTKTSSSQQENCFEIKHKES